VALELIMLAVRESLAKAILVVLGVVPMGRAAGAEQEQLGLMAQPFHAAMVGQGFHLPLAAQVLPTQVVVVVAQRSTSPSA
jgi:hypothetical protein